MDESAHIDRIGPRIRSEREHQGLTVSELSAASGVGRATVSDLERAARTPTLETLAKIADGLGVPIPALLQDESPLAPLEPLTVEGVAEDHVLDVWLEEDVQVEVHRLRVTGLWRRPGTVPGARGYITGVAGRSMSGSAATPRPVGPGDQVRFSADRPHMVRPLAGAVTVVLVLRYPRPTA